MFWRGWKTVGVVRRRCEEVGGTGVLYFEGLKPYVWVGTVGVRAGGTAVISFEGLKPTKRKLAELPFARRHGCHFL